MTIWGKFRSVERSYISENFPIFLFYSDLWSKFDNALKRIEELSQNDEKLLKKKQELTSYKELRIKYEDAVKRIAANTENRTRDRTRAFDFQGFARKIQQHIETTVAW